MIAEFDMVALKHPIPDRRLPKGARGTVVDAVHIDDGWVTVEFFHGEETVAVLPVSLDDLQPAKPRETKHSEACRQKSV